MPRERTHRIRCRFRGGPADGLKFTILAPLGVQLVLPQLDLTAGTSGTQHRYTVAERSAGVITFEHQGPLPPP